MSSPLPTVVLIGATATGKSELGIRLAESLRTEIINADSRQVYRHLDIGTAKPSAAQRLRVAHHLIDVVPPDALYDAAQFAQTARGVCRTLQQRAQLPLLVGGCGLYIRATVTGLFVGPEAAPELRRRLAARATQQGIEVLHEDLRRLDPACAATVHPRDRVRIIRALEVYHLTGRTMSEHRRRQGDSQPFLAPWFVGLQCSRRALRERIAKRAALMVRRGLFEEVEGLLARGYDERCQPLQGFGYQHLLACVRGTLGKAEAMRRLVRDTQRYAKRQETWFRRVPDVQWFDVETLNLDRLHAEVVTHLRGVGVPVG